MIGKKYKILPTKEFSKDFRKLNNNTKNIVKNKIEELPLEPKKFKHLHYNLKSSCRLRIGKLRIIFSYNLSEKEIYLEKIVFKY